MGYPGTGYFGDGFCFAVDPADAAYCALSSSWNTGNAPQDAMNNIRECCEANSDYATYGDEFGGFECHLDSNIQFWRNQNVTLPPWHSNYTGSNEQPCDQTVSRCCWIFDHQDVCDCDGTIGLNWCGYTDMSAYHSVCDCNECTWFFGSSCLTGCMGPTCR